LILRLSPPLWHLAPCAVPLAVVVGSRFFSESEIPIHRTLCIRIITWPIRMTAYPGLRNAQSGFRTYSRRAVMSLVVTERGMGADTEISIRAAALGLRLEEVPIGI